MSPDQSISSEAFLSSAVLLFSRIFCGQHSSLKQPQTDRQTRGKCDFLHHFLSQIPTAFGCHIYIYIFRLSLWLYSAWVLKKFSGDFFFCLYKRDGAIHAWKRSPRLKRHYFYTHIRCKKSDLFSCFSLSLFLSLSPFFSLFTAANQQLMKLKLLTTALPTLLSLPHTLTHTHTWTLMFLSPICHVPPVSSELAV